MMCHLITAFSSAGYKVASLKHHVHLEDKILRDPETDTGKHLASGACMSTLVGPQYTQITYFNEPSPEEYITFYGVLGFDIILIEGFKHAPYPKAVLLRSEEDLKELQRLENIQAFVIPESIQKVASKNPVFYRENPETFTVFIKKWMESQL